MTLADDRLLRVVTINAIQRIIADKFGLGTDELIGESSKREVVLPRQIGMYVAKQVTDASLAEIGSAFGGKHHSTVMNAISRIGKHKETDTILERFIEEMLADPRIVLDRSSF